MKKLKNLSLFKLTVLLLLTLFTSNILVFILSVLFFIIYKKYRELVLYLLIILLTFFLNCIDNPIIKVGIVDTKNSDTSCIINNFIYNTKASSCEDVNIGDVVILNNNSYKTTDINYLKKQIYFINNEQMNKIYTLKIRSYINSKINTFKDDTKGYLRSILLNEYNELDYISFGFTFYYLFMFIYKKNKIISYISLFMYIILFGFDIKLILILVSLLSNLFDLDNISKISLKILLLLIINKYLLLNYSILITLLISFIYVLDKDQKFYLSVMQSLLFNCINPVLSFLYKYIIIAKMIAFILAFITILFNPLEIILLTYIKIYSFILNITTIEIRGKLTIYSLIFILLVIKLFNIRNQYLKILLIIVMLITPLNNPFSKVTFIDVGQGDSILIRDKFTSGNILIDTGSSYNYSKLKRYLYSQGIYKIDYLILSHNDEDHNGNIENLKKDFNIKNIVEEGKDVVLNKTTIMNLNLGKYDNDNDNSLVYYINFYGLNYLFTGDISKNTEKSLISKYPINVDILKIGHHGSKNSSSSFFISSLMPRFAVISTNGMYSHPHKEVIDILNKYQINTLITKELGNIEFINTSLFSFIKSSNNDFVIINT